MIKWDAAVSRRTALRGLALTGMTATIGTPSAAEPLRTAAATLAATGFAPLRGPRIGLITNQTGRVGDQHLVDLLRRADGVRLTSILAPEHGFRGTAEAGAAVKDGRDPTSGLPVLSLYGATRKPTPEMLRDLDALVFDIQDVGVRFYTYISTMGLAMQAAAQRRIPFIVLDRPNPIGGADVSGFVLEPARRSFVGQYPIPIVHGMSVGELARMIKGAGLLDGLDPLDLQVHPVPGWKRTMRWPETGLPWVATSPNVPTFETALVYPGIGLVGEALMNEGRGTPTPFLQFGAPWLDAQALADRLDGLRLPGARFEPVVYTPRSIPNVAAKPRFEGQRIGGVRLVVTDVGAYAPLETGVHVLAVLQTEARTRGLLLIENTPMFHAIAGTRRLYDLLDRGAPGAEIIASWRDEVARFRAERRRYLLY